MRNLNFTFLPVEYRTCREAHTFHSLVDIDDIENSIKDIFRDRFKDVSNFKFHQIVPDSCNRYVVEVSFDVGYCDYDGIKSTSSELWNVYKPIQDIKDFYAELEEAKLNAEYI